MRERLIAFIGYLGISIRKFEASVGLSNGFVKNITGNITLRSEFKISQAYPDLNMNWLLTGEGEMLKSNDFMVAEPYVPYNAKPKKIEEDIKIGVPYYDIDVTASIVTSFDDVKETPEYYVDYKPFNNCTAYFPVYGSSMYPKYCSGEVVAVRQIFNLESILWGEAYLIVTDGTFDNLRTIKLLFPHDAVDKIILRSSNPNYKGDTVVSKKSIVSIFAIQGKITREQM